MNLNTFLFTSAEINRLLLSPRPDFIGFGQRNLISQAVIEKAFNFWNLLCVNYNLTSYFDVQLLYDNVGEGGYEIFFDTNLSILITKDIYGICTLGSLTFHPSQGNIDINIFRKIFSSWN